MLRSRALLLLASLFLAPMLAFALKILWDAGELRRLETVIPECRTVTGILSSEDITIDPLSRFAFISGDDRRGGGPGNIYSYDLNRPNAQPIPLIEELPFQFHPHGLSLVRERSGEVFLLVVNQRDSESTIERFRWEGAGLIHEMTYRDPMIRSPNDVAAISRDQFYVSVKGRSETDFGRMLEYFFQLGRGYVTFFDGQQFEVAASGFSFANGVQLSADQSRLFVAATVGRTISIFARSADNRLHLEQVLDLKTGVHNIEVDLSGGLWIGAHPKSLRFLWYMGAADRRAPSEVFRIRIFEQTIYQKVPFFVDPAGRLLSASSVGAYDSGRLLVGSVADPHFLDCKISDHN